MKNIGIMGLKQSGKTTVANFVKEIKEYNVINFADEVKKIVCEIYNIDLETLEFYKNNPEPIKGFPLNMRESLIFIGDNFRKINPNYWIEKIDKQLTTNFCVADCRYFNELKYLKKKNSYMIFVFNPFVDISYNNDSEKLNYFIASYIAKNKVPEGKIKDYYLKYYGINYLIINDSDKESLKSKVALAIS